jgi:hypothetical protein
MQQFRGLLIAVVLLAALGGGVYWSNQTFKEGDDKAGKSAGPDAPKILEIPDSEVKQLEFRKKGQETTVVKRVANAAWEMTAPKPLKADVDALIPIVNLLAALSSESLVDDKVQDWATYGLKDPAMELVITKKDGKTVTLQLGDEIPAASSMYARVAGESKLYTLASYNRNSLDKTWKDLRDKKLLSVDSDKVSRMEVLSKGGAFEFGKNQSGEWQIVKPNPYRADNFAVQELSQKLRDAKLDPQLSEESAAKNVAAFGAAVPVATAKLTDATGTQQLEVRKAKDKDVFVYYAKSSSVEGVHKVGGDLGATLEKSMDDFRNKKLFDFGFNDPTKVEIKIDGAMKSYGKNGEKWFLDGKEMKPETVQNLIDKFRDLSAAKFVANPAKQTPSIEITVLSSDGKKSETVRIAGILAARGDETYMYELASTAVEELKTAANGISVVEPPKPAAAGDAGKKK